MSDQTVTMLRELRDWAAKNRAVVDRVEVSLREDVDGPRVEFKAFLSPIPLEQATVCAYYTAPLP